MRAMDPPLASRRRRWLAVYIDYLLYSAISAPAFWLLRDALPAALDLVVPLLLFAAARYWLARVLGTTPGRWLLGIEPLTSRVSSMHTTRETWWTLLAGTLLILEGSKNLVRWTLGIPPFPVFGLAAPEAAAFAAISAVGLLNLVAGWLILRTRALGALIGAIVVLIEAIAVMIHRDSMYAWVEQRFEARRTLQGVAPRPGEIELMHGADGRCARRARAGSATLVLRASAAEPAR